MNFFLFFGQSVQLYNFSSEGNGFQDYYKDLADRVKRREVDLLIVVNMFLTGFDNIELKPFNLCPFKS